MLDSPSSTIALFPLTGSHLFPGLPLPVYVFEDRYKAMIDQALTQKTKVGVVWSEDPNWLAQDFDSLICGVGTLQLLHRYNDNRKNIVIDGQCRARVTKLIQQVPFCLAEITLLEQPQESADIAPLKSMIQRALTTLLPGRPQLQIYVQKLSTRMDLCYFAANYFIRSPKQRQWVLEQNDPGLTTQLIEEYLVKQLERTGASRISSNIIRFPSPSLPVQ